MTVPPEMEQEPTAEPTQLIDPYISPRIRFGTELRKFRLAAGFSQRKLGEAIHLSISQLSMLENGHRSPTLALASKVDEALNLGTTLTGLLDRLNRAEAQLPRWFRPWLEFEREAESLRIWSALIVPGLLQTEDYARAILSRKPGATTEEIEDKVAARMERQEILRRRMPPMLWIVIDEGVLYRPVAEPDVMRGQCERLLEAGEHLRISLQILPYEAHNVLGLLGSFTLADLARETHPVAYIDSQSLDDRVTDRPIDMKNLVFRYEAIRSDALSRHDSLNLIKETMRRWTT
ncbi:helix-turn-helix domain-containing protein [Streptosporangium carneum]|uniref:Transcriptional regulator n=1 Tax=Streptosporangium carneum TaxID=47481 RepID=A0A9W6MEQ0_9ACTN|nr:helix-turn-helix transcriptional regulator [Streptosporangium carneum]GLK11215.1 transcriptional regulator [Streptosporangium carneum]